jgi:hypothetical protein
LREIGDPQLGGSHSRGRRAEIAAASTVEVFSHLITLAFD